MSVNNCRKCGIELTEDTWLPCQQRQGAYICKFCERKRSQEKYTKNKDYINNKHKLRHKEKRMILLKYYSNETMSCACCGENNIEFLTIDHINNDGHLHRQNSSVRSSIYNWLIKNHFPAGFQVLCFNCNMAKGIYGICPHKKESI